MYDEMDICTKTGYDDGYFIQGFYMNEHLPYS